MAGTRIDMTQVSKRYGREQSALDDLGLVIEAGERLAILGPSGSGKTTLLRLVAGLETADRGLIRIGGTDMRDVPPHRRDVAIVFQEPALYPFLSVFDNLGFGLRARGVGRRERQHRVRAVAGLLKIDGLLSRRPSALSGGERQRVALGRAIVRRPGVLLLDEPFSSLDEPLRQSLRAELVALHGEFGGTLLHVTHDQAEAMSIGQRMAVLQQGRLMQVGTPEEIYQTPSHRFVAEFVGSPGMNLLPCDGSTHHVEINGTGIVVSPPASIVDRLPIRCILGVRPEHVAFSPADEDESPEVAAIRFPAIIKSLTPQGFSLIVALTVGHHPFLVRSAPRKDLHEGQTVQCRIKVRDTSWFDAESGSRVGD